MQAALAYSQFKRIDYLVERRREVHSLYKKHLNPDIELNYEPEYLYNSFWATTAILPRYNSYVIRKLSELEIPSRPFFRPLSSLPAFKEYKTPTVQSDNRTAYGIQQWGINLPYAGNLSDNQVIHICEAINKICER
jgi:perosamine synthetase